jgi:hypothetical protein
LRKNFRIRSRAKRPGPRIHDPSSSYSPEGFCRLRREVQGILEERASRGASSDGNSVDMEVEMGKLAENQILFNASIQILSKKFEGLKYAVKEVTDGFLLLDGYQRFGAYR